MQYSRPSFTGTNPFKTGVWAPAKQEGRLYCLTADTDSLVAVPAALPASLLPPSS